MIIVYHCTRLNENEITQCEEIVMFYFCVLFITAIMIQMNKGNGEPNSPSPSWLHIIYTHPFFLSKPRRLQTKHDISKAMRDGEEPIRSG